MHSLLKFVWFSNSLARWFQKLWQEKWRRIFPSRGVYFIAWILLLTLWNVFLLSCISTACPAQRLRKTVWSDRHLAAEGGGRKLILRNLMYPTAPTLLPLNFRSCFLFRHLHKLNKHFFPLPALLIGVCNAILRPYFPLKLTCSMLGLQWQPARSLRASPVPKRGKMNSTTEAALHCGVQQHELVSIYQWAPAASGKDRAVGFGCTRKQAARALIPECTYLNRSVFILSIALKPLRFLLSLQLGACSGCTAEPAWLCWGSVWISRECLCFPSCLECQGYEANSCKNNLHLVLERIINHNFPFLRAGINNAIR